MLIAILSDIHDNLVNLQKCLDWCTNNKISKLIFCGDLTTAETIKNLAKFDGEIFVVQGNAEIYNRKDLAKYKNITDYGEFGLFELDQLTIGLTHEPAKVERLKKMTKNNLDFIFYGHTHKPWLEKKINTYLINPGNVSNTWYGATFAVLDTKTKKIELKLLNDI